MINKKHKEILLSTFKAFINFCDDNNLQYVAAYGTVLGAVRHGGIIPWDDDIDVFMDRHNYNKFLSVRNKLINSDYEIMDIECKGYYLAFAKFCNRQTTIWEHHKFPFLIGVFVDVFPLDYVNDYKSAINNYYKIKKSFYNYQRTTLDLSLDSLKNNYKGKGYRVLLSYFISLFYRLFNSQIKMKRQYEDLLRKNIIDNGKYFFDYTSSNPKILPKTLLTNTIDVVYDGLIIKIPSDYDNYLTTTYGNWKELPPMDKRISHPHYFIDLDRCLSIKEIKEELNNNER